MHQRLMQPPDLVSLIIVNWNGIQDTIECLNSLASQYYSNLQTIVIDNGSIDQSIQILQQLFGEKITLISNKQNLGYAKGNNIGIQYALNHGAKYVVLLNNDTIVSDPQLISKLVLVFSNDDTIGLACPTIYYESQPTIPWYAGAKYSIWLVGGKHIQHVPQNNKIMDTGYATGCCLMINRNTLLRVGLLDEDFYIYEEDVDWSLRVKNAGLRVVYVPYASVLHKVSKSATGAPGSGKYSPSIVYHIFRSRIIFIRKHGRPIQKYILWPTLILLQVIYHTMAYMLLHRWQKIVAMYRGVLNALFVQLHTTK
jgi:GT2 family glycosyltransferase